MKRLIFLSLVLFISFNACENKNNIKIGKANEVFRDTIEHHRIKYHNRNYDIFDSLKLSHLNLTVYKALEKNSGEVSNSNLLILKYNDNLFFDALNILNETHEIDKYDLSYIEHSISSYDNLNIIGLNQYINYYEEQNNTKGLTIQELKPILDYYFMLKPANLKSIDEVLKYRNSCYYDLLKNEFTKKNFSSKESFFKYKFPFNNYIANRINKANCLIYDSDCFIVVFELSIHSTLGTSFLSMKSID